MLGVLAGAQCKNGDNPNILDVTHEADLAEGFTPRLQLFYYVSSVPRDAVLQREVRDLSMQRRSSGKLPVEILFFDDVVHDLAADPALITKHWRGWQTATGSARTDDGKTLRIKSHDDTYFARHEALFLNVEIANESDKPDTVVVSVNIDGVEHSPIAPPSGFEHPQEWFGPSGVRLEPWDIRRGIWYFGPDDWGQGGITVSPTSVVVLTLRSARGGPRRFIIRPRIE